MMANINRFSLIIGMAALLSIGINGLEKRCYRDNTDPPGVYRVNIRDSALQITALDSTNTLSDCKSSLIVDVHDLLIKFNTEAVPPVQTLPDPQTKSCHITYDSTTKIFELNVAVQQNANFLQLGDLFSVTCDFDTVDVGFKPVTALAVGNGDFIPAEDRTDSVDIELLTLDGSSPISHNVGDKRKIRVTYNLAEGAKDKEYPIGLHNFDLTVAPDSSTTPTVLINENGCKPTTTNPFAIADTYTHNTQLSVPNADGKHVFETGEITLARFIHSSELHFKGFYRKECFAISETKCFNQVDYCATNPTRKRRAIEPEVNGTYTLNIKIGMPGQSESGKFGDSADDKTPECAPDKTFWIVAVVLGAVLLLVMMVTIYFFSRLRTEQRRFDKSKEKSCFENPTF